MSSLAIPIFIGVAILGIWLVVIIITTDLPPSVNGAARDFPYRLSRRRYRNGSYRRRRSLHRPLAPRGRASSRWPMTPLIGFASSLCACRASILAC